MFFEWLQQLETEQRNQRMMEKVKSIIKDGSRGDFALPMKLWTNSAEELPIQFIHIN
jgi:hypothetical protein